MEREEQIQSSQQLLCFTEENDGDEWMLLNRLFPLLPGHLLSCKQVTVRDLTNNLKISSGLQFLAAQKKTITTFFNFP